MPPINGLPSAIRNTSLNFRTNTSSSNILCERCKSVIRDKLNYQAKIYTYL